MYYHPKQTWEQLGPDFGEALNRRFAKQNELFAKAKAGADGENASTGARKETPATLEELRTAFLNRKGKEKKKDRTSLDRDTIRAYEQLTDDFIYLTKCQFPCNITGEKVNDWMDILEDGYTGRDAKVHKPACPRTVYNLYTNLSCFLRFCGIEPNPDSKHSYGLRKLQGTNVPAKAEGDPEAFTEQEWAKFMFVITDERHALAFETMVLTGPREQELTHLEWFDLELDRVDENSDPASHVWFRCKYDKQGKLIFRTKTGKDRWVPLEQGLAERLRDWQRKNWHRKYVFGTRADKVEGHFLRYMKEYAKLSGQDPKRWWLHKCRDTFASWCLRRKIDLRTIQAWLGHASIAMTTRYLATLPDPEQHQKIQALGHMLAIVKRNEAASI